MSVELVVANYLRIALEDWEGAKLLASSSNRNAAYLCQQAAEKIIRAVLTTEGVHAGIKHDLAEMVDSIPDANPLKPKLRAIEHLAAYATTYRYPTSVGRIKPSRSAQDINADLSKVRQALDEAARCFGVALGTPNTPASAAKPAR
jgi:HEPN domain-containing protein